MSRIGDDIHFVMPPEIYRPATSHELLEILDVEDQPHDIQQAAINRWMLDNEPRNTLLATLEIHGFTVPARTA